MTYSAQQRAHYNEDRERTCTALDINTNQYNAFRRIGQALHRIYENNCNGEYESDEAYDEVCEPYYKKADALAKRLKLYVFYQTDPRGATIYLSKEPIPSDRYH